MGEPRFVFVSGGVVSGVGKGIASASIAALVKARGFTVSPIKCDMYVNVDAGTMNPTIHGEVFVADDGIEADQDLGHYERFLDQPMSRKNYTTTGQVYAAVIERERKLEFDGHCVEVVPHIPEEIINRLLKASEGSDFTFVELGGTVGEYQSVLFLEATRILAKRLPGRTVHVHVSYFPFLPNLGELKSKPTQLSIRKLNESGILPDFVIARSAQVVDAPRFNTLCQNSNLTLDQIVFSPDVSSVYEVPLMLEKQGLTEKILRKLGMNMVPHPHLENWTSRLNRLHARNTPAIRIGIVEKYHSVGDYTLNDSYVSVIEALTHASIEVNNTYEIVWLNAEDLTDDNASARIGPLHGLLVPQGWGSRGAAGKIAAIKFARENRIPYFGLCYGMQMAAIEFALSIGLNGANSAEVDPTTPNPVIHIMEDQASHITAKRYGGTIRVGAYPCRITENTLLGRLYGRSEISERHRHRYEFNNSYRDIFTKHGMIFSGLSPDGNLVEAIELTDHPFFLGVQFHPEYKSTFETPHPLFIGFLNACLEKANGSTTPRAATAAVIEVPVGN